MNYPWYHIGHGGEPNDHRTYFPAMRLFGSLVDVGNNNLLDTNSINSMGNFDPCEKHPLSLGVSHPYDCFEI